MTNALPSVEKTRNPASRPILPPYSWVTQPLSVTETAFVALMVVPVNVPHPEIVLVGAGVLEIPQPPDIRSLSWVPLGLFFEIPVTCLQSTPKKLSVVESPLPSLTVKMPSDGLHSGLGPESTVGAVAGLMPWSVVTKKFATLLRPLPESVGEVSTLQEHSPGPEQT